LNPPSRPGQSGRRPATALRAHHEEVRNQSARDSYDCLRCLAGDQDRPRGGSFGPRKSARVEQDEAGVRVLELAGDRQRRREASGAILERPDDVHDRQLGIEFARQPRGGLCRAAGRPRSARRDHNPRTRNGHPWTRANSCSRIGTAGSGALTTKTRTAGSVRSTLIVINGQQSRSATMRRSSSRCTPGNDCSSIRTPLGMDARRITARESSSRHRPWRSTAPPAVSEQTSGTDEFVAGTPTVSFFNPTLSQARQKTWPRKESMMRRAGFGRSGRRWSSLDFQIRRERRPR
jgi:hypothetical protein